jgi:iron complex outermembrane receptor protein
VRKGNNQFMANTSYGGFTQWQVTAFQRVHTLSGLRLGTVDIDFHDARSGAHARTSEFRALPRVGAVFDLTDDLSLFAGYSEGMRGQPFVNFSGNPMPELSRQMEAGLKFDFSAKLSGQIAVYQIERRRIAVRDPGDALFRTRAAGQQRSRGIDLDLVWEPLPGLGVLASYAHTEARFTDDLAGVPEGNWLPQVPKDAGRFWLSYRFQRPMWEGLNLGAGIYLRSGAYLSNNNRFKTDATYSVDCAAAYETGRFKLAATVKNLSGAEGFQPYDYFDGRVAPLPGRAVFVSGEIRY